MEVRFIASSLSCGPLVTNVRVGALLLMAFVAGNVSFIFLYHLVVLLHCGCLSLIPFY